MTAKRIGSIGLASLALTVIIFVIEINVYSENNLNKNEINTILFWSLIRAVVISIAVNIGNHIRSLKIDK